MLYLFFYVLLILIELIFSISFSIFTLSMLYSSLKGAPFVPTKSSEACFFLKEASLKPGQYFLELGCGDGRVVRHAVTKYQVKGLGIDINPLLVLLARTISRFKRVEDLRFETGNIVDPKINKEIKKADIIYLFMMPKLIMRLIPIFKENCKKDVIIISHGFNIEGWDEYIYKTINHRPFSTYFYRL